MKKCYINRSGSTLISTVLVSPAFERTELNSVKIIEQN